MYSIVVMWEVKALLYFRYYYKVSIYTRHARVRGLASSIRAGLSAAKYLLYNR